MRRKALSSGFIGIEPRLELNSRTEDQECQAVIGTTRLLGDQQADLILIPPLKCQPVFGQAAEGSRNQVRSRGIGGAVDVDQGLVRIERCATGARPGDRFRPCMRKQRRSLKRIRSAKWQRQGGGNERRRVSDTGSLGWATEPRKISDSDRSGTPARRNPGSHLEWFLFVEVVQVEAGNRAGVNHRGGFGRLNGRSPRAPYDDSNSIMIKQSRRPPSPPNAGDWKSPRFFSASDESDLDPTGHWRPSRDSSLVTWCCGQDFKPSSNRDPRRRWIAEGQTTGRGERAGHERSGGD